MQLFPEERRKLASKSVRVRIGQNIHVICTLKRSDLTSIEYYFLLDMNNAHDVDKNDTLEYS